MKFFKPPCLLLVCACSLLVSAQKTNHTGNKTERLLIADQMEQSMLKELLNV